LDAIKIDLDAMNVTREDVISLASEFVSANRLEVERLESADFITFPTHDEASIPQDILETYLSVKSRWRNYWVVRFRKIIPAGVVESPETEDICVYETGEVIHWLHP